VRSKLLALALLVLASASGTFAACNSPQGDCPAKAAIVPGAACASDQLQCAYDLATPSLACDGTTTVIPSSCTCAAGAWSCPSPVECADAASPAEDGSASEDASQDAAPGDASNDSGQVDAHSSDAADAGAADTSTTDGPADSGEAG
jgi:hypothetical protein